MLISGAMALPAAADERPLSDGVDLLSQGTRMLMEGLMDELAPALDGLKQGLSRLEAYHPPEILPNGDIIIRRKAPAEVEPPADGIEL